MMKGFTELKTGASALSKTTDSTSSFEKSLSSSAGTLEAVMEKKHAGSERSADQHSVKGRGKRKHSSSDCSCKGRISGRPSRYRRESVHCRRGKL